MRRLLTFALTAAAIGLAATPAQADAPVVLIPGGCASSLALTTPDATACQGYYTNNALNGSDIALQQNAIAALPGPFVWDGDWTGLNAAGRVITSLGGPANNRLDFGQMLSGTVIIGAHWGNIPADVPALPGQDAAHNVSVFWLFNLLAPVSYITLDNVQGWSNAALYANGNPPVPEPATWAMMLLGFAGIGMALRGSARQKVLMQVA